MPVMKGITGLLFLLLVLAGMSSVRAQEKIMVFVSILPQKYLVERIGGERVQVEVMVRPGVNAETYEPSPRQMTALTATDVYFRIGVPFEKIWIKKISSVNPGLRIIDCCEELMAERFHAEKDNVEDDDTHIYDAHVWTSPRNALYIGDVILKALTALDPAGREYYANNHALLVQDLNNLDQYIRDLFANLPNRYLVVAHPSWSYFADDYDLTQVALVRHGVELRPRELADLVELTRNNKVHTVYIEKQFESSAARLLAREINADIVVLDPLAEDYIDNLKKVAQAIVAGGR